MSNDSPRVFLCPVHPHGEIVTDEDGRIIDVISDYYVTLPPRWLGRHAGIKEEAVEAGEAEKLNDTLLTFAVSLALADDYKLPGLDGKPENWDFDELALDVVTWVNYVVWRSFNKDFTVKKNYLLASMNGNIKRPLTEALGETGTT